jgi:hypothetical protein
VLAKNKKPELDEDEMRWEDEGGQPGAYAYEYDEEQEIKVNEDTKRDNQRKRKR